MARPWHVLGLGLAVSLVWGPAGGSDSPRVPPGVLLSETGRASAPVPFVDANGSVYVTWVDESAQGRFEARFRRSEDWDRGWEPSQSLDRTSPSRVASMGPEVRADGQGRIVAAWRTKHPRGDKDILVRVSEDFGRTWQGEARKINVGRGAFLPEIGLDRSGRVYVVWYEEYDPYRAYSVYFNASIDGGKHWLATDARLNTGTVAAHAWFPRLGHDDAGRVYAVWREQRGSDPTVVFFAASADAGRTWPSGARPLSDSPKSADNPQLVTGPPGHLFVAWTDRRNGQGDDIYFTRSTDHGQTWLPAARRLDTDAPGAAVSTRVQLAAGPAGHVYAAWEDYRHATRETPTASDIYVSRSTDTGETWLPADVRLTPGTAAFARNPRLVADVHGRVVVAWQDARSGTERVYLTYSLDGGRTWLPEPIRLDASLGPDQLGRNVALATDGQGTLAVAWEARRSRREATGDAAVSVVKLPPAVRP